MLTDLRPTAAARDVRDRDQQTGKEPDGWIEWPALLRKLDRIDPTYRD
jgi:hypothetical protein